MTNAHNGEVAFPPLAGEAVLRFTVGNLIWIESRFRADYDRDNAGKDGLARPSFVGWLIAQIGTGRPAAVAECLKVGLKKPGGKEAFKFDETDPPFPFASMDVLIPLCDALNLAANGETFTAAANRAIEQAETEAATAEAAKDAEPPPASPKTSRRG